MKVVRARTQNAMHSTTGFPKLFPTVGASLIQVHSCSKGVLGRFVFLHM